MLPGISEAVNANTYKLVKSGILKVWSPNFFPQGKSDKSVGAASENLFKIADCFLFVIKTNPSYCALTFNGSWYV